MFACKTLLSSLLVLVFFVFSHISYAQVRIEGQVFEYETKKAIGGAVITLTPQNSGNVLTYTQANENGTFSLKYTPKIRVFLLKVRHLSYEDFVQQIVLAEDNQAVIRIEAQMIPKSLELKEVVIKEPSPIIVKKDTIIYDVSHWQQTSDQTLEQVLEKMPGFVVLPNGELKYNGKPIAKVLVDGKELSNAGAALMTRSIDPNRVESVEVRTNEKSKKLKNSLLDTKEMLVLDIKLKEGLDNSLFGKVRATVGYQNKALLGGYFNFLQFGKKTASHLFAERDLLGNAEISIFQIRNLGSESMAQLFELPADYESLTKREGFNTEMYGFKDYSKKNLHIAGLTTKYTLSPNIDIFFGSYNHYEEKSMQRNSLWRYAQGDNILDFRQVQNIDAFESKNKLDMRWDTEKMKSRLDLNVVYSNQLYANLNNNISNNNTYNFAKREQGIEIYPNLFFEYTINPNLGVQVKSSYAYLNNHNDNKLNHNDSTYSRFFSDEKGILITNFQQKQRNIGGLLMSEAFVQYQSKLGMFRTGAQLAWNTLDNQKQAYNLTGDVPTFLTQSAFTGTQQNFSYKKLSPYISQNLSLGKINLTHRWGAGMMAYPDSSQNLKKNALLEYSIGLEYSGKTNFSFSWQQRLSTFPLAGLMNGADLRDFRHIVFTRQNIFEPKAERVASFSVMKKFKNLGTDFTLAGAYGSSYKSEQFLLSTAPFVASRYAQLNATYYLGEIQLLKTFKKSPLKISLVNSFIRNEQENSNDLNNEAYQIYTMRFLQELNFDYRTPKSRWGGEWKNKVSTFLFSSNLSDATTTQQMLSTSLTLYFEPIFEKLTIHPAVRYVHFLGAQVADFTNLACTIQYQLPKVSLFVEADNLLNNTSFVRQNIQPLIFNTDYQMVFVRYVKFGVSMRIN